MDMFSAVSSLVSPFVGGGSNGVMDGMKLVVLGGTVETARRVSSSAWSSFVNSQSPLACLLDALLVANIIVMFPQIASFLRASQDNY